MLTKVRNLFSRKNTKTSGFTYRVAMPNRVPVVLRAKNQVEVRAFVRDTYGLTRLPAGTTVTREN